MSALGVTIQEMPSPAFFDMNDLPYGAVLLPGNKYFVSNHKKDPGQRASCGCMAAKDIGEYNTCPHLCEYCYANSSKKSAIMNWEMHRQNPMAENDNRKVEQQTRKKLTVKRLKDSSSFFYSSKSSIYSTFLLRSMLGTTLPL